MTVPCGSFCHAFDNRSLHFVNWGRNYDDGRPSAAEHLRRQVNRVQIRAIRWTTCLAEWTEGSHAASSVFLAVWEGAPPCCTVHLKRPHLTLMSVSYLPSAKKWCLTFRLVEWKRLLLVHSPCATQRRTPYHCGWNNTRTRIVRLLALMFFLRAADE